ncbi:hypothetical protein ACIBTZ_22370 [Micromonospora sp. NPDC049460]|uniref:hypothetical protein n=1 Tax=Micromonospora sp. NPDC049460 TaxID=3364272 RepID=UPI00378F12E0
MMLLVPADVLRPRRPDEHFADEAEAARQAGIDVAVIDHDAFVRGQADGGGSRQGSQECGRGLPGVDAAK